jgi:hypothetical protein
LYFNHKYVVTSISREALGIVSSLTKGSFISYFKIYDCIPYGIYETDHCSLYDPFIYCKSTAPYDGWFKLSGRGFKEKPSHLYRIKCISLS